VCHTMAEEQVDTAEETQPDEWSCFVTTTSHSNQSSPARINTP
jgi:hypothetical protein